jgi:hypothetical protein
MQPRIMTNTDVDNYVNVDNYIDVEAQLNKMFMYVLLSWDKIRQVSNIMSVLNMNTNKMCMMLKEQRPMMYDSHIQAYVLSFLFTMMNVINTDSMNQLD